MSYNFHCYNFNPTYVFLIIITLKTIDIVSKNYILVTDCRERKKEESTFFQRLINLVSLNSKSDSSSYIPPQFGAQVTSHSCRYNSIVKQCQLQSCNCPQPINRSMQRQLASGTVLSISQNVFTLSIKGSTCILLEVIFWLITVSFASN